PRLGQPGDQRDRPLVWGHEPARVARNIVEADRNALFGQSRRGDERQCEDQELAEPNHCLDDQAAGASANWLASAQKPCTCPTTLNGILTRAIGPASTSSRSNRIRSERPLSFWLLAMPIK